MIGVSLTKGKCSQQTYKPRKGPTRISRRQAAGRRCLWCGKDLVIESLHFPKLQLAVWLCCEPGTFWIFKQGLSFHPRCPAGIMDAYNEWGFRYHRSLPGCASGVIDALKLERWGRPGCSKDEPSSQLERVGSIFVMQGGKIISDTLPIWDKTFGFEKEELWKNQTNCPQPDNTTRCTSGDRLRSTMTNGINFKTHSVGFHHFRRCGSYSTFLEQFAN